jgi:hypothetical protein
MATFSVRFIAESKAKARLRGLSEVRIHAGAPAAAVQHRSNRMNCIERIFYLWRILAGGCWKRGCFGKIFPKVS